MNQRIPRDRGSFKLGLSALFQRIHRRGLRAKAVDWDDPQTLPDLLQILQKIACDELDIDAVMDRVVKLASRELGADGAGVWLFTDNEIFYCAGAGEASNDERLRLTVLSMLAAACRLSNHTGKQLGTRVETCAPSGAGLALGHPRPVLIEPIRQGQKIAGVLAAFSSGLDKFTGRDADKIHLLADLLAQAQGRSADHASQYVALEPAAVLELVEGMIPALQKILSDDEGSGYSTDGLVHATTWTDAELVQSSMPDDSAVTALHCGANVPGRGGQATSESEAVERSNLRSDARPKWDSLVTLVKDCVSRGFDALMIAGGGLANRVEQVGSRVWQTVRFRTPRPLSQLDVRRPQRFPFRVWADASSHLKAWFRTRPSMLIAAPVFVVLLMTVGFLISKARHDSPGQTRASSLPTKPEKTVAADADGSVYRDIPRSDDIATTPPLEAHVAQQAGATSQIQVSHLRVTDRSTHYALRTLSRYEFTALRRRALYGDDFAEFLIGMAYETGHGLRQNCEIAAEWVAKAAAQGNAPAEYNLGLRYRDGDGVPVNQDAALKWLQKAAARHIPGSQVALMAVAAQ
jgi:hypothetical protein